MLLAEPTPITGGQELNRFLLEACIDRRPQPFAGLPAFVAQAQCQFRGNSLTKRGNTHMGANRVYRGGSWNDNARNVRAANRNNWHPGDGNSNLGFRCARAHPRTGRFVPDPAVILSAIAAANSNKPPVCE
ncbi:MAG: SUMF1/EgtB/PvdO family nonheme iron enzyme [bacterium]